MDYLDSTTVQLSVTVGSNSYVGDLKYSTVIATSVGDSDVEVEIESSVVALQFASVSNTAPDDKIEEPYRDVTFVFEIYNSGNGLDTFNITGDSSRGWDYVMDKTQTNELDRFGNDTVEIVISIPVGEPAGEVDTFTLVVRSVFENSVSASATVDTTVKEGHGSRSRDGIFED
jgi:uncharacterized membrane protein